MSQTPYTTLTVKQTRDTLAEILDQVDYLGKRFVVKKFGKVKALIIPVTDEKVASQDEQKRKERLKKALDAAAGMWADRDDMADPVAWVNNIRKPRYELNLD